MRAETIFAPTLSPVGTRDLMQVMPTGRRGEPRRQQTGNGRPHAAGGVDQVRLLLSSPLADKIQNNVTHFPATTATYRCAWMHHFGGGSGQFIERIPRGNATTSKVNKYYAIYNLLYQQRTDVLDVLADHRQKWMNDSTKETWERHQSNDQRSLINQSSRAASPEKPRFRVIQAAGVYFSSGGGGWQADLGN